MPAHTGVFVTQNGRTLVASKARDCTLNRNEIHSNRRHLHGPFVYPDSILKTVTKSRRASYYYVQRNDREKTNVKRAKKKTFLSIHLR